MTDETPAGSLDATPDQVPEEAPKPRRRRRTRAEIEADKLAKAAAAEAAAADGQPGADEAPKPRRRRASRKKAEDASATQAELPIGPAPAAQESATSAVPQEEAPKPRRRRRTRAQIEADERAKAEATASLAEPAAVGAPAVSGPADSAPVEPAPKPRRRRRTRAQIEADERAKAESAEGAKAAPEGSEPTPVENAGHEERPNRQEHDRASFSEMTRVTQEATQASSIPAPMPAATLAEADQASEHAPEQQEHFQRQPREHGQRGDRGEQQGRRRRVGYNNNAGNNRFNNGNGGDGNGFNRRNQQNHKQHNRHNGQPTQTQPSLSRDELQTMKVADLRAKAAELGVEYVGVHKSDLVEAVYLAAAAAEGFRPVDGILEMGNAGAGWIRTGNYMKGDNDAYVSQQLIRNYALRPGDHVEGTVGPARTNTKYPAQYPPLIAISLVNGREPEAMRNRPRFRDLSPIYPNERLVMECGKDSITGRAIDLVAPIGKGQRGLIVSPPKAGKTTVLKKICQSISANNPEVHLVCLLVDERPEEVTDMQRSIRGEVVASTFDMPADNHTAVSELVIEHAKRLVELGEDVVVVLDSITRLARAYNLAQPASGRILSGGVDSAALYPPKKFLGAARNIENGGSLTIIASALVDTGSKMDEVIFEEFKGTGNMELKLDRELADKRIFPAIDPVSSGTRNEDLLLPAEITPFVWGIRRVLANMNNTERAASALVKGLKATNSNEEFLIRSAKKAAQSEYVM